MRRVNAQQLSVSTLILVALGILVLIISIVFYANTTEGARDTVNSCDNLGGQCMNTPCAEQGLLENHVGQCGEASYCCVGSANS